MWKLFTFACAVTCSVANRETYDSSEPQWDEIKNKIAAKVKDQIAHEPPPPPPPNQNPKPPVFEIEWTSRAQQIILQPVRAASSIIKYCKGFLCNPTKDQRETNEEASPSGAVPGPKETTQETTEEAISSHALPDSKETTQSFVWTGAIPPRTGYNAYMLLKMIQGDSRAQGPPVCYCGQPLEAFTMVPDRYHFCSECDVQLDPGTPRQQWGCRRCNLHVCEGFAKKLRKKPAPSPRNLFMIWVADADSVDTDLALLCVQRMFHLHADSWDVHFITSWRDFLDRYVSSDNDVDRWVRKFFKRWSKLGSGFRESHLSDLARLYLVNKYGGMYVDATQYNAVSFDKLINTGMDYIGYAGGESNAFPEMKKITNSMYPKEPPNPIYSSLIWAKTPHNQIVNNWLKESMLMMDKFEEVFDATPVASHEQAAESVLLALDSMLKRFVSRRFRNIHFEMGPYLWVYIAFYAANQDIKWKSMYSIHDGDHFPERWHLGEGYQWRYESDVTAGNALFLSPRELPIYGTMEQQFFHGKKAANWLRTPESRFGGMLGLSPLDQMMHEREVERFNANGRLPGLIGVKFTGEGRRCIPSSVKNMMREECLGRTRITNPPDDSIEWCLTRETSAGAFVVLTEAWNFRAFGFNNKRAHAHDWLCAEQITFEQMMGEAA